MSEDRPALEDCGFIRVPSPEATPLWMTCEQCRKSDHFWLTETHVHCRCGARYSHAVRPDGETISVDQLEAVPFSKGPMALADLEWDFRRLGLLAVAAAALIAAGVWALQ